LDPRKPLSERGCWIKILRPTRHRLRRPPTLHCARRKRTEGRRQRPSMTPREGEFIRPIFFDPLASRKKGPQKPGLSVDSTIENCPSGITATQKSVTFVGRTLVEGTSRMGKFGCGPTFDESLDFGSMSFPFPIVCSSHPWPRDVSPFPRYEDFTAIRPK